MLTPSATQQVQRELHALHDTARVQRRLHAPRIILQIYAVFLKSTDSQGVPSSVPVVRECEGSREEGGLEVEFGPHAFSEKKMILRNTKLLTCPGIVGASDRLYYRP